MNDQQLNQEQLCEPEQEIWKDIPGYEGEV